MQKIADDRSGLPLLLIYAALVVVGVLISIAAYWTLGKLVPQVAEVMITLMLMLSMIAPWPIAVWIEQAFATRLSGATAAVKSAA